MEKYGLGLSLEVCEGSIHNQGHIILFCRLRASSIYPYGDKPEFVILYRGSDSWSPPAVRDVNVTHEQMLELVSLLKKLGWPGRELQVAAVESSIAGLQTVECRVNLDGQSGSFYICLQYAGVKGEDAVALRAFFRRLMDLGGIPGQESWISGTVLKRQ